MMLTRLLFALITLLLLAIPVAAGYRAGPERPF